MPEIHSIYGSKLVSPWNVYPSEHEKERTSSPYVYKDKGAIKKYIDMNRWF